jgi:GNAT superfamily N-acetyltransferase
METIHLIRLSIESDLPFLAAVERDAGRIYDRHVGRDSSHTDKTLAPDILRASHKNKSLWVAEEATALIAFLAATKTGEALHIEEISVAFDHQGRGVGEQLVTALLCAAKNSACKYISLTTDRRLPWSRNFYRKLGFQECRVENCSADLTNILRRDKEISPAPENRIAMILSV